jgi:hypothetical protein
MSRSSHQWTPEQRAAQSKLSIETWERRRVAGTDKHTAEAKARISAAMKGKRHATGKRSPESCERMRQAALRRWARKRLEQAVG